MFARSTVLFCVSSSLLLLSFTDTTTAQTNGDLRLAQFSTTSFSFTSGRLEIYVNRQWGTVCGDSFSSIDADVACRQMGFSSGGTTTLISYGSGSGPIHLDEVGCTGSESCLLSCSNRGIGVQDCSHSEDVAISCFSIRTTSTDCSNINTAVSTVRNGDLRLARGSLTSSSYTSGRLEIYINGQWGTVCGDSFFFNEAGVACRQLGFSGGTTSSSSSFVSSSVPIWLDDVSCFGTESCLLSCYNRGIGVHNCGHSEDVAVSCSGARDSTSTDCTFISTPNIVGIAVGVTVGVIVLFVVIPIVICVVCFCCVAGGAAASSRRPRTVVTTTPAQAATTATVVTTGSQQAAYPQTTTYPPSYPQSYPAAGTDVKQAPPPAYTAQPTEMSTYPPQPQAAYPAQPQAAYPAPYPPQPQDPYPPQAGYPPQ